MIAPPPEPRGGQDGPPDVRTSVVAVLRLLADVRDYLETHPAETVDLRDRLRAHRHALVRLRNHLDGPG